MATMRANDKTSQAVELPVQHCFNGATRFKACVKSSFL